MNPIWACGFILEIRSLPPNQSLPAKKSGTGNSRLWRNGGFGAHLLTEVAVDNFAERKYGDLKPKSGSEYVRAMSYMELAVRRHNSQRYPFGISAGPLGSPILCGLILTGITDPLMQQISIHEMSDS